MTIARRRPKVTQNSPMTRADETMEMIWKSRMIIWVLWPVTA